MNTRATRIASAIASTLACSLLAACGGGSGGLTRTTSSPPPVTPPPAAPPPTAPPTAGFNPCPAPVTGDCIVQLPASTRENLPAMSSPHALVLRGGELGLVADSYRFDGGTRVEAGWLGIGIGRNMSTSATQLTSALSVSQGATVVVWATVNGDVSNAGQFELHETVNGRFANHGRLYTTAANYGNAPRIVGDFVQGGTATLAFALAPNGWDSPTPLHVFGRAELGGTLELIRYNDAWGSHPLPATIAHHILHADGGVFGSFDRWTSPGLFVEGSLRYGSNDVWFDLARISLQAGASANGIGSALTLASAGNIDRALAAEGFIGAPGIARQHFLASASRLLWMSDPMQAQRALDSLSGLPQAVALDAALHDAGMPPALSAHLDRRALTHAAGAWAQTHVAGMRTGFDHWLGPQLLAGVHAARADGALANAGLDASSQHEDQRAGAYARWLGHDGWYAGADAGHVRRTLRLDRRIDFGSAGHWNSQSRRMLHMTTLGGEAGRMLPFAGGRLTPFLRLDAGAVHGAGTIEQGGSGFELALDPVMLRRLDAGFGLRYARDWRASNGPWLQLHAGAGMRHALWKDGDPQRAAFTGAPTAWFDLPGAQQRRPAWFELGLQGGFGHDWRWAMQGMHGAGHQAWHLRLARNF